jgi:hypothetical protein
MSIEVDREKQRPSAGTDRIKCVAFRAVSMYKSIFTGEIRSYLMGKYH